MRGVVLMPSTSLHPPHRKVLMSSTRWGEAPASADVQHPLVCLADEYNTSRRGSQARQTGRSRRSFEFLNASSGLYAPSGLFSATRGGYVDDDMDSRSPPEVGGRYRSFPRWGKERRLP